MSYYSNPQSQIVVQWRYPGKLHTWHKNIFHHTYVSFKSIEFKIGKGAKDKRSIKQRCNNAKIKENIEDEKDYIEKTDLRE